MCTVSDYIVSTVNLSTRDFSVVFQSQQSNSSEFVLVTVDDDILEGMEYFRLRIIGMRFTGQASQFFRPQDGVNNTFVDVIIEDNDCKPSSLIYITHDSCLIIL